MLDRMLRGLRFSTVSTNEPMMITAMGTRRNRRTLMNAHHLRSSCGDTSVCVSSPHASPPLHTSCFQMGTDDLMASMQNRAAANASGRCGEDTTTTTADDPM